MRASSEDVPSSASDDCVAGDVVDLYCGLSPPVRQTRLKKETARAMTVKREPCDDDDVMIIDEHVSISTFFCYAFDTAASNLLD